VTHHPRLLGRLLCLDLHPRVVAGLVELLLALLLDLVLGQVGVRPVDELERRLLGRFLELADVLFARALQVLVDFLNALVELALVFEAGVLNAFLLAPQFQNAVSTVAILGTSLTRGTAPGSLPS
jgi:hypothetical protein